MAAPKGNKYAIGNNGGRPPLFNTPDDFSKACDEYFQFIEGEKKIIKSKDGEKEEWVRYPEPATVTGLALYLGFCSKSSLFDYQNNEEFSSIVKRARTRVEHEYEKRLHGDKNTGAIFALKNMDWKDKTEVDNRFPDGVKVKHVYQDGNDPLDE